MNSEGKSDKESLVYERQDFWATTSNKHLNFLQHVKTLLKINGRAAIVVPDNVLFEGGSGEIVRRKLLTECDAHTLLRLPAGVFYAQGVKANVLFFDRKPASEKPWTERLWIYDLRTNMHFTLKENPLRFEHLQDFIKCYNPENRHDRKEMERFRAFTYEDLVQRDKFRMPISIADERYPQNRSRVSGFSPFFSMFRRYTSGNFRKMSAKIRVQICLPAQAWLREFDSLKIVQMPSSEVYNYYEFLLSRPIIREVSSLEWWLNPQLPTEAP